MIIHFQIHLANIFQETIRNSQFTTTISC